MYFSKNIHDNEFSRRYGHSVIFQKTLHHTRETIGINFHFLAPVDPSNFDSRKLKNQYCFPLYLKNQRAPQKHYSQFKMTGDTYLRVLQINQINASKTTATSSDKIIPSSIIL